MARIEVVGGTFVQDAHSRFAGPIMVLYRADAGRQRRVRHPPGDVVRFAVRDGAWERFFTDAGDWSRAMGFAAVAGLPAAGVNLLAPTFFLGQQAVVTWANSMIGAAAATAALKSDRMVRFDARFANGAVLQARVEERRLMQRLPLIYRAMRLG